MVGDFLVAPEVAQTIDRSPTARTRSPLAEEDYEAIARSSRLLISSNSRVPSSEGRRI